MQETTIYTYKTQYGINPNNIDALQDGPSGPLNIGILDTGDYDYTYVSGISGSFNKTFVPSASNKLSDLDEIELADKNAIISNLTGGTANILLQTSSSHLTVNDAKLDVNATKYEELQIIDAKLKYNYAFVAPLIITGATLNCQTQSQLLITNASLNLNFKKILMNLPIVIGAEFRQCGIHCAYKNSGGNSQWTGDGAFMLVIHDPNGADYNAYTSTNDTRQLDTSKPANRQGSAFRQFQNNTGARYYRGEEGVDLAFQSSIIRVKHPFGDPQSTYGGADSNLNNYIVSNQRKDFKWFIYNGLIDNNLEDKGLNNTTYKAFQNYNAFNAVVSGNKKLFDHSVYYNTVIQVYDELCSNGWGGEDGNWMVTSDNRGVPGQLQFAPAIVNMLYVSYADYITNNYTLSSKNTRYTSGTYSNQNYSDILNMSGNIQLLNKVFNIGETNPTYMAPSESAVNYYNNDIYPVKNSSLQNIQNLVGGIANINLMNTDPTPYLKDCGIYNFDIGSYLQRCVNNNNQQLNITSIQSMTDNVLLSGQVQSIYRTERLNLLSDSFNIGDVLRIANNQYPRNVPLSIGINNNSYFNITYCYNGLTLQNLNVPYTPGCNLIIGSAQNGGQSITNPNAKLNIRPYIEECKISHGANGPTLDINRWATGQDRDTFVIGGINYTSTSQEILFNDNRYTLQGLIGTQRLYGDRNTYTIDLTGYYDFNGNTAGFTGKESINFSGFPYAGTTHIDSQIVSGGAGYTGSIDITSFLTSNINSFSQEVYIPPFYFSKGETGYYSGIPELGISGSSFSTNQVIFWKNAQVSVQYNYSIGLNGQLLVQNLLEKSDTSNITNPISITNKFPITILKSYDIPNIETVQFPLTVNDPNMQFLPYESAITLPELRPCIIGALNTGSGIGSISPSLPTTLPLLNNYSGYYLSSLQIINPDIRLVGNQFVYFLIDRGNQNIDWVGVTIGNITNSYIYNEDGTYVKDENGVTLNASIITNVYPTFALANAIFGPPSSDQNTFPIKDQIIFPSSTDTRSTTNGNYPYTINRPISVDEYRTFPKLKLLFPEEVEGAGASQNKITLLACCGIGGTEPLDIPSDYQIVNSYDAPAIINAYYSETSAGRIKYINGLGNVYWAETSSGFRSIYNGARYNINRYRLANKGFAVKGGTVKVGQILRFSVNGSTVLIKINTLVNATYCLANNENNYKLINVGGRIYTTNGGQRIDASGPSDNYNGNLGAPGNPVIYNVTNNYIDVSSAYVPVLTTFPSCQIITGFEYIGGGTQTLSNSNYDYYLPRYTGNLFDPTKITGKQYTRPALPSLNIDNATIGIDKLLMDSAKLRVNYSYGDSLYQKRYSAQLNFNNPSNSLNLAQNLIIPTQIFLKQQRSITFPYSQITSKAPVLTRLFLGNVRKNKTGYTFTETPFNIIKYDETFTKYKIVNYSYNGFQIGSDITKLINLNDYTLSRTNNSTIFFNINDVNNNPSIDLSSRIELSRISNIIEKDDQITELILNNENKSGYIHRFFVFNYLNSDNIYKNSNNQLFLLVSSSPLSSTALSRSSLLDCQAGLTYSNIFTATNDYTYDLTNQNISINLVNGPGGETFHYNGTYLNPASFGNTSKSYSINVNYSTFNAFYRSQNNYFGLNTSSPTNIFISGLLPNTRYSTNFITYYPTPTEYITLGSTGSTASKTQIENFSFKTGNTGIIFNAKSSFRQNNDYVYSYSFNFDNLIYITAPVNNITEYIDGIKYKLLFGYNDSDPVSLYQDPNHGTTFLRNLILNVETTNFSDTQLNSSYNYSNGFLSSNISNLITASNNSTLNNSIGNGDDTIYISGNTGNSNMITSFGLQRGKTYNPRIYLCPTAYVNNQLQTDIANNGNSSFYIPSYRSNEIYLESFTIPLAPTIGIIMDPVTKSSEVSGTLTNFDIYTIAYSQYSYTNSGQNLNTQVGEITLQNSTNLNTILPGTNIKFCTLFSMDGSGNTGNINLLKDINDTKLSSYRTKVPATKNIKFKITNLIPNTTYNNINIRVCLTAGVQEFLNSSSATNILGGTTAIQCASDGLISSISLNSSQNINNIKIIDVPSFTTLQGTTAGEGITGIPYITTPSFYNSMLNITKFNYFNNDSSNSYPSIYGGDLVVSDASGITYGILTLSTLRDYPLNISIPLNQKLLDFNQQYNFIISYQWKDFNINNLNNLNIGVQTLTCSALIKDDKTSILDYNNNPLYSKIITYIDGANYIGDMTLNDLQCDLKLAALSQNPPKFIGTYNSQTLYNKYDCVINNNLTNLYWLEGSTSSIGNNPSNSSGWVNITNYLPIGYTYDPNGASYTPTTNGGYTGISGTTYSNIYYKSGNLIKYYDSNYGYNATFGNSYFKASYITGGYQSVFQRCFPNTAYNISYIKAESTLSDNTIITLNSTSIPLGITKTLNNLVFADSLTGSTSTYFTMNNIHYQNSQDIFTQGNIYLNGNTGLAYPVFSSGITFSSLTATDYFTYQPQLSISKQVFDQSAPSQLFYPTLNSTSTTVINVTYKTARVQINNFSLIPPLLDPSSKYSDYLVVVGPTGYKSQSFNILTAANNNINSNNLSITIDGLIKNTSYNVGDFKIYFKDKNSNDRLSTSFLPVPAFTTPNGLQITFSVESGVNKMYLTLTSVSLNNISQDNLFSNEDPANNLIKVYLYKSSTVGTNHPIDTDYSLIVNNKVLPLLIPLPETTQGAVYDYLYMYYKIGKDIFEENIRI